MKQTFAIASLLVCALLTGCQTKSNIPQGVILKQVNQELAYDQDNLKWETITVGRYECNDADRRLTLRKYQAAGLITYSVTRYAWWEKQQVTGKKKVAVDKWSFWSGYYTAYEWRPVNRTDYEFFDHYVVDVQLTGKGKKCVLTEKDFATRPEDKDMQQPEVNPAMWAWNLQDLTESWEEIPNPFVEKKPAVVKEQRRSEEKQPSTDSAPAPTLTEKVTRIDSLQCDAYKRAILNAVSENVMVKEYGVKAVKARNITIGEVLGRTVAHAEVIYSSEGVTDFGRVNLNAEDGIKAIENYTFVYFEDKGWVLKDPKDLLSGDND